MRPYCQTCHSYHCTCTCPEPQISDADLMKAIRIVSENKFKIQRMVDDKRKEIARLQQEINELKEGLRII